MTNRYEYLIELRADLAGGIPDLVSLNEALAAFGVPERLTVDTGPIMASLTVSRPFTPEEEAKAKEIVEAGLVNSTKEFRLRMVSFRFNGQVAA